MNTKPKIPAEQAEKKKSCSIVKKETLETKIHAHLPTEPVLSLQQKVGNQAVQRLLKSSAIQAKLEIGEPDDKYEREADRVAEHVMSMPDPWMQPRRIDEVESEEEIKAKPITEQMAPIVRRLSDGKAIQGTCAYCSEDYQAVSTHQLPVETYRLCTKCRAKQANGHDKSNIATGYEQVTASFQRKRLREQKEDKRQLKEDVEEPMREKSVSRESPKRGNTLEYQVNSLKNYGQPLPKSIRNFFEPRFRQNFSKVRVHNDSRAISLSRLVNARAFTFGQNVVFGEGEYSPESNAGRKLLAHELTHVVQQNHGMRKRVNAVPEIQLLEDCDNPRITGWSDSLDRVVEAHENAVQFATAARAQVATVLRGGIVEPSVQRALNYHYGNPNNAQLGIIVTYYNNIVRRLNQGARAIYLCVVSGCGEDLAIQRGTDRTKICPGFFNSTVSDLTRAGILIEEAAHFAGVSGDHYIYTPGYPGRTPHNNGPSYGYFGKSVGALLGLMRMRPHRPITPQPPTTIAP